MTRNAPGRGNSKQQRDRRRRILERDGFRCLRCGAKENLTIDHIVPISRGGTYAADNLQTLCEPCNEAKGDRISQRYYIPEVV